MRIKFRQRATSVSLLLSASLCLLPACATRGATAETPAITLPSESEVTTYIRDHWDDWSPRLARFAERKGETSTFVDARNISCDYYYSTPQCTIDVTGAFTDGSRETRNMIAQFDRDTSGQLVEVIVMYHIRKR